MAVSVCWSLKLHFTATTAVAILHYVVAGYKLPAVGNIQYVALSKCLQFEVESLRSTCVSIYVPSCECSAVKVVGDMLSLMINSGWEDCGLLLGQLII